MKKLLSMLAIGTLVTTSVPSANMIINTSFNQKINNIKNENDINKYKLINRLINFNQPDYFGNKYNGFVYKQEQKIDINDNFISLAKIDDKTITIPNFQVSLDEGEHEVSLLLKSDFKNFYNLFNADENGFVHYKFWIKKNIKNNIKSYKFNLNQSINNINNFWIDKENNIYIYSNDKLFKVNVGTRNAIEIKGYNGLVENIILDKNDNLYFITDKLYKVTIGTDVATEISITNLSNGIYDLIIDSQNNMFIFSLNGFFKVNHGTTNAIKISGLTANKPINNVCIDNQGNIFVNQDSSKIYVINVGTTQATEITFNFIPIPTPTKPMPTGEIIVIVASSLLGLGILGFGGYFIYYDRKHHVVKNWWEKRKEGK